MRDAAEIIHFRTRWGRFPLTRAERHRLARLHGLPELEALRLAYGPDCAAAPLPPEPLVLPGTYPAEELARAFEADGTARLGRDGLGILPRCAGAGRAGV